MASLTHVSMWSEAEHEWRKITASEAARLYPGGTVSANSGLFVCELCGQYVILTNGRKNVRYFKHNAYDTCKDCPERTIGLSSSVDYIAEEHELPIRLSNITRNDFELEIGLLYIPISILQMQKQQQIIIQPLGVSEKPYIYSFERLNSESITYLYVGTTPAYKYVITSSEELRTFWPRFVNGIDDSGSIFDQKTGKKVVDGAEVQVGKAYYLLCPQYLYQSYPSIEVRKLCEKKMSYGTWYIYEVQATAYKKDAARFFFDFRCRLTETPVSIQPVWPIYVETPYVIRHRANQLFLHIRGKTDITTKVYPETPQASFLCPNGKSQVISLTCKNHQHMISVGRSKALLYTYLWKENMDETTSKPIIEVTDKKGNTIEDGSQYLLPEGGLLSISAPFDGTVILKKNNIIFEKRNLKGGCRLELDDIQVGVEIKIFQGLDLVWSVYYEHKQYGLMPDETAVLKTLDALGGKMIPVTRSIGSAVNQLKNYPKLKRWVYKKIKLGNIPEDAFRYLKRFLIDLKLKQ
ncbi:hypothetical protein [Enterocloster citroniae]|uniref:hypothetical protein n=1 Tax=Enterocloster citroniae TaxID=358743 RepID=UPI00189AE539|nr:hypothetical protein [Enterocloster citroniae]